MVADAFTLEKEKPATRDRYGRHLWGQSCLLARRLAEAGVSVSTIDARSPVPSKPISFSWHDHANPATGWHLEGAMRFRAPFMDQGLSALIEDIDDRGLDRKVLVVAVGEFGRTPRLASPQGVLGRDHWPSAQSALVSDGGLRMAQVIGATTSKAEYPVERLLSPQDLLATTYRHLGIDFRATLNEFASRPQQIFSAGEPISELILGCDSSWSTQATHIRHAILFIEIQNTLDFLDLAGRILLTAFRAVLKLALVCKR